MTPLTTEKKVYSVSALNRAVKLCLEERFASLWLTGEISNLARPKSGHLYFSIKDAQAQVRCAMFRGMQHGVQVEDGMQVLVRARVSLYEARGDYQLIVEQLEEAGDGALRRKFEKLKEQLAKDGLFADEAKRPLPEYPKHIGVITSATGAAIRDILSVLKRRFPAAPVCIYPTLVQGAQAAPAIAKAIQTAVADARCDVLIVSRGGGSLEDLWGFNEAIVAEAIYRSPIPVVSGVGHEVDVTIADYVADVRAATPSAAAERVSPDHSAMQHQLRHTEQRLQQWVQHTLQQNRHQLLRLSHKLRDPSTLLREKMQRLDELEHRLTRAVQQLVQHKRGQQQTLRLQLQALSPITRLRVQREQLQQLYQNLQQRWQQHTQTAQTRLARLATALQAISPLATLGRGYALVTHGHTQQVLTHAQMISKTDPISVRLQDGTLTCTVTHKEMSDAAS